MKKVFSILAALLLCFSLPVKASASTVEFATVQPYYEIASKAESKLSINGTTAICESHADGDDVVEITANQYLQRQGLFWAWTTYDDAKWSETVYTNKIDVSNTKTGLKSGKYRLKTDFILTDKYGKTEKITAYSDVVEI